MDFTTLQKLWKKPIPGKIVLYIWDGSLLVWLFCYFSSYLCSLAKITKQQCPLHPDSKQTKRVTILHFFVFFWRLSYFCRKLDLTFVLFLLFQHSLVTLNRKRHVLQVNFKLNFCFMVTIMGPCQTNKIFSIFSFVKTISVSFHVYEPFSGFIMENCWDFFVGHTLLCDTLVLY